MTITYTAEVATSSFGCFLRLLIRWKGSIYRMVWVEFLIFAGLFFGLSALYRFVLTPFQRTIFESVVNYCEQYNNLIPIAFVLGFYVSIVVERWWGQYVTIPWPDRLAVFVTAHLQGQDERARLMRRTIMRYMCLSYVITLSSISPVIKKRFPTFRHMTEAGFMTEGEQKILESINMPYNKYWIPLVWSTSLVTRARKENRIKDDMAVKTIVDEVNSVRGQMGHLFNYDWITVPLVYTQVVTLAVYMYLASCLMGHQFIKRNGEEDIGRDVYFPLFTFLQFFFYMGWLKVAEAMVNPFGEDDDDFNVNYMIDRNLQIAYMIVDDMHQEHPELIRDQYWDNMTFDLPYTQAAEPFRVEAKPLLGSAMNLSLDPSEAEFTRLESVQEDDSGISGNAQNQTSLEPSELNEAASQTRKESAAMRFLRGLSRRDSTSSTSPLTSSKSAPCQQTSRQPSPSRNDRSRRTSPSPSRNERLNSRSSRFDAVSAHIPEENENEEYDEEKRRLSDIGSGDVLLPKSRSDSDSKRGV